MKSLYEINFKVGRRQYRWCRFANSAEQATLEAMPVILDEYGKGKIVSVSLTSIEAEEQR